MRAGASGRPVERRRGDEQIGGEISGSIENQYLPVRNSNNFAIHKLIFPGEGVVAGSPVSVHKRFSVEQSPSVLPGELWAVEWSIAFYIGEKLLELARFGINISPGS